VSKVALLALIALVVLSSAVVIAQPRGSEVVDNVLGQIEDLITTALDKLYAVFINVARGLYMLLAVAGVLLYATGFNAHRGKQLIIGAIIIAVLLEFVATA